MPATKWWNDPVIASHLSLSIDQQKRMEAIFQQSRIHLIDLTATLEKENALLDPLLQAEHPDETKILPQIDRVAQARAELEKANARLLLGIRLVLTPDQWRRLQAEPPRSGSDRHGRSPHP